jgi:hypothetical protein
VQKDARIVHQMQSHASSQVRAHSRKGRGATVCKSAQRRLAKPLVRDT